MTEREMTKRPIRPTPKTARRRANGRGSVWWDDTRQRYMAQIVAGYRPNGQPIRRTVSARTQDEIETRLDELQAAQAAGPTLADRPTVSQWLTFWVDKVLPTTSLAPRTRQQYADVGRWYIDPTIGRRPMCELTGGDVTAMIAALQRRGLSGRTVHQARSVLRRSLTHAVRYEIVTRNVATKEFVDAVPVRDAKRMRSMTAAQATSFLAAADVETRPMLVVLLGTGMRVSECLGLRWSDVRLDGVRPTLTVNGQLGRDGVWTPHTKTLSSRRTIDLPAAAVAAFREQRARQAAQRLAAGPAWPDTDMVWTEDHGRPRRSDGVTRMVSRTAKRAELGHWSVHELRHTAGSLMLDAGIRLEVVSRILGHSSIRVTADVYGHEMPPVGREAAEAMQAAIFS